MLAPAIAAASTAPCNPDLKLTARAKSMPTPVAVASAKSEIAIRIMTPARASCTKSPKTRRNQLKSKERQSETLGGFGVPTEIIAVPPISAICSRLWLWQCGDRVGFYSGAVGEIQNGVRGSSILLDKKRSCGHHIDHAAGRFLS